MTQRAPRNSSEAGGPPIESAPRVYLDVCACANGRRSRAGSPSVSLFGDVLNITRLGSIFREAHNRFALRSTNGPGAAVKKRAGKVSGGYSELDVFTNTMLVVVIVIVLAAEITVYSEAGVESALTACAAVRESLEECMQSYGYVSTNGDDADAPEVWESKLRHRLLVDL